VPIAVIQECPIEGENLADTLMERVDRLAGPSKPIEWGDPLLSTTPTSMAIHELAVRTQALMAAVRDIAFEVEKLAGDVDGLQGTERQSQRGERR
jgi:hypothetical protein